MNSDRDPVPTWIIRPLREGELTTADRIFRQALGTFLGLPDPQTFGHGSDPLGPRWRADPTRVFAADYDGRLVGTNVATNWGSLGFFGPLTVSPDMWGKGIGHALIGAAMDQFTAWNNSHLALFTFPNSPKHIHLYEQFGFTARFLTPILSKPVEAYEQPFAAWTRLAALTVGDRAAAVLACREVADTALSGLDLTQEIEMVLSQQLGDVVLLLEGSHVRGFAVCHCGAGTEAGPGECFIKFGTVQPGSTAPVRFSRLLHACEAFASSQGLDRVSAGINMGCDAAYRLMRQSGYRIDFLGIAMQQPNDPAFNRPDRYVLCDWR